MVLGDKHAKIQPGYVWISGPTKVDGQPAQRMLEIARSVPANGPVRPESVKLPTFGHSVSPLQPYRAVPSALAE